MNSVSLIGWQLIHRQLECQPKGRIGRISLYKGKQCIEMNIPEEEAIERLVELIKQHGDWREP